MEPCNCNALSVPHTHDERGINPIPEPKPTVVVPVATQGRVSN